MQNLAKYSQSKEIKMQSEKSNLNIAVIGGGPGGLYFSILTKKALPNAIINVYEQNKPDDSFGFGVVFSDETLSEFLTRDPKSYELIRTEFAYWDDLDIAFDGQITRISGNGFCGCSRKKLLQLLHQRCQEEGVNLHFETTISDLDALKADVIVASDGINSQIRTKFQNEFGTKVRMMQNHFVWMGSTKPLDAFTYFFKNTEHGVFAAHTYQYEPNKSTWIFECSPTTWQNWGFDKTTETETVSKLEEMFSEELDGHGLITNKSFWRQFPHVTNEKWHYQNIVLLGDAKATAHYSIGSGTKLAMESAIALSDSIVENPENITLAFVNYEQKRRNRVEMIQHAALVSLDWFENMDRHAQHPFYQFAFGVMTRAKKVTYENLQLRDARFTAKVLEEFLWQNNIDKTVSPAFTPYKLREIVIPNRIVMSPMGQYSAENGLINNWHLIHYGSRAVGGVGLILTEMTAVSQNGRITEGCAGIYNESQTLEWQKVVQFVHQNSDSKIGIQLGHSGRKGAQKKPSQAQNQAIENPWELIAPSPIAFNESCPVPKEMDVHDMNLVKEQFITATKNAVIAGFDMIELQAHHGFLLGSFLSPLTNVRADEFGGSIENRLRFPVEIFNAIRANFPGEKPISIRISASDWAENGISEKDVITIATTFKNLGADIINVSTGNTVANQKPAIGRMWQVPFSDHIRNTVHIPTITTGFIQDIDQINTIILNGRADLVALGRPLLADAYFVRNAQAHEQFIPENFPLQYKPGLMQAFGIKASERKSMTAMRKALKPESHKK